MDLQWASLQILNWWMQFILFCSSSLQQHTILVLEHLVLSLHGINCHPLVQFLELPLPSTACQSVLTLIDGKGGIRNESDSVLFNSNKNRLVWDQEHYLHIIFFRKLPRTFFSKIIATCKDKKNSSNPRQKKMHYLEGPSNSGMFK